MSDCFLRFRIGLTTCFAIYCCLGCCSSAAIVYGQQVSQPATDTIVLRDLQIIDANGALVSPAEVTLADGTVLSWANIRSAELSTNGREFETYRARFGDPLFRMKSRLLKEDWGGAGELSQTLFPTLLRGYSENREYNFLVCFAEMKRRLLNGERARAVLPFQMALQCQTLLSAREKSQLKELLLSREETQSGIASVILPFWFNPEPAQNDKAIVQDILTALKLELVKESAGLHVYLASLYLVRNEMDSFSSHLDKAKQMGKATPVTSWIVALNVQEKYQNGKSEDVQRVLTDATIQAVGARAVLQFLQAENLNVVQADDLDKKLLALLTIPAIYGDRYPNLAAKGLDLASGVARQQNEPKQVAILRNELLRRYPNTYHGKRAKKALSAPN